MLTALLSPLAHAIDGNDELHLELATGESVSGWFYSSQAGELELTGANTHRIVPIFLVSGVVRDGEPLDLALFHSELLARELAYARFREHPPPHPAPSVAFGASLLWAGAGHAALGDWRSFALYSIVEAGLVGTATWAALGEGTQGTLLPVAAVDLLFRGYAAGESARIARARRRALQSRSPLDPAR